MLALVVWSGVSAWAAFAPAGGHAILGRDVYDHVVSLAGLTALPALIWPQVGLAAIAAFWGIASAVIEGVQPIISPGRERSFDDLLTSLAGIALGCVIVTLARAWISRRRRVQDGG